MATTTAITTPMIAYFSAPITPSKGRNKPLSVTARTSTATVERDYHAKRFLAP
jgi:hypothetical protein